MHICVLLATTRVVNKDYHRQNVLQGLIKNQNHILKPVNKLTV